MAAVRIVTDSACDLSDDEVNRHGIEVVPLTIRFGGREFVDRVELSTHRFYEELAASPDVPQTAAPSPGAFASAFTKCKAEGASEVVCINLSSALSATMQAAQNGATAVADDIAVRVVDSKSITGGLGTIVVLLAAILSKRMSPLVALMQNQVEALRQAGVRAASIQHGQDPDEARETRRALLAGELDFLYVTPERIVTERFLEVLDRIQVSLFAIDEAHCVSQWGHDFRPEYAQLGVLARYEGVPRIAVTATADERTKHDIVDKL